MAKIRIKFHKELYPVSAVKKAAEDFKKAAKIFFQEHSGYYSVTIDTLGAGDELEIRNNFINYVLILSRTA